MNNSNPNLSFQFNPNFKRKNTKEKILSTAYELFLSKGYDSTSIEDILKKVSIAKGTFYHHFVSKESLLETVTGNLFVNGYNEILKRMERLEIQEPLDKLNGLFRISLQWKDENFGAMMLLLQAMALESNLSLRFFVKTKNKEYGIRILESILEEGKNTGKFSIQSPKTTADILCSILESLSDKLELDLLGKSNSNIIEIIKEYQFVIEKLLGLEENSIELLDMESYQSLKGKIRNYLESIKQPNT